VKLLHPLRRIVLWIGTLSLVVLLLDYSLDVSKRLSLEPTCIWDAVDTPKKLPYVVRYCHLTKDTVVLRIYDAKEKELLAERMYFEQDMARIYWVPRGLLYDSSMSGVIPLPPTFIDRLRAKLP
jgi:hypothetical protein